MRVLVPTQITFALTGDGAIAVIDPPGAGAPTPAVAEPPSRPAAESPRTAARSGLIVRQCCPSSSDTSTYCAPMYSVCGFCGEKASGGAPPKRSVAVG